MKYLKIHFRQREYTEFEYLTFLLNTTKELYLHDVP